MWRWWGLQVILCCGACFQCKVFFWVQNLVFRIDFHLWSVVIFLLPYLPAWYSCMYIYIYIHTLCDKPCTISADHHFLFRTSTAFFEWQDWWELIPKHYWLVKRCSFLQDTKNLAFFVCIALKDLTQKPRVWINQSFVAALTSTSRMFHSQKICGAGSQLTIILGITSTSIFPTLRSIENRWGLSGSAMTEALEDGVTSGSWLQRYYAAISSTSSFRP